MESSRLPAQGKTGGAWLVPALLLLTASVAFLDARISLGVAVGALYVPGVLLSAFGRRPALTFGYASIAGFLTLGGLFLKPPVDYMWKAVFNRSISLFCIGTTAALVAVLLVTERRREAEARAREEAQEELGILRGMLPICASCKRIKDDAGSWRQIEEYISHRSQAVFTHGICPECMRKLYPEYAEDD